MSERIDTSTPVILGREAFSSLIVDLDIPGRRLSFHDPKQWRPPNDAVRLSLTRADGARRQTPISIEGRPAVLAIFDLGGASPVVMPESYAQQAGVLDGRPRSQRLPGGRRLPPAGHIDAFENSTGGGRRTHAGVDRAADAP